MKNKWLGALCATLMIVVACGAGTEARAQYSRKTPIVEAVQKTRDGIVSLKVEKRNSYGKLRSTTGTGVIVDERGYIVTNWHVAQGGHRIVVRLRDDTELIAKMVAEDTRSDLTILRIRTKKKLTALPLAPGSDVMVGETVIAIGHPFGYRNTVSTGIISAVEREIEMPSGETLAHVLQTNASINPGNSGGPLLNINGELIGINVALREGAQGIAFAINSDTVKQMVSKHLSALKVAGVLHGLACKENAVASEGKERQRVVVSKVRKGTPAAQAGLKSGDQILEVGKRAVRNRFDVERALWNSKPGQLVELKVIRQGKTMKVALKLSSAEEVEQGSKR
jgi:serine protease Do